jgi:zinc transport system ATP-binding protein
MTMATRDQSTVEADAGADADDDTVTDADGETAVDATDDAVPTGTTDTPVVDVDGVSFGYTSTPVVEDVSMRVDAGEYVAVVGPNGSGKSTLLKIVLGLLRPDGGDASLFGEPAHAFDDGQRIGYVAQHASASKEMPITVREVVNMGRYPHVGFGRLDAEDRAIVEQSLETVGMSAFANRRVTNLSGGQRQRAFIARALASEADLLVLDEPTVGVDAESVDAFYDLLDALHEDGITVLLVEHDLNAVVRHADRVVCINREVYFDGSSDEFVESDALARAFGTAAALLGEDR